MLLQSLYDYSVKKRLLDDLPRQKRMVHLLIAIDSEGKLRDDHIIDLKHEDDSGKEKPGREIWMPRFPGENNGGKAYFLAAGSIEVLGTDKNTGEPITISVRGRDANPYKAFQHFWTQIEDAYSETQDPRLNAILKFKERYIQEKDKKVIANLSFISIRTNEEGNPQLIAIKNNKELILKSATFGFSVDGSPVTLEGENNKLNEYWSCQYIQQAFADDDDSDGPTGDHVVKTTETVCCITGLTGLPIARSHKPKILKIPNLSSGGYVVSFAQAAPAFSSYGWAMGENCPISERAASSYALALNTLLADEDACLKLGSIAVCCWAKNMAESAKPFRTFLDKPHPEQVRDFLRAPFSGNPEREILLKDRLITVALSGGKGRVIVRHWLDQAVEQAIGNFKKWWEDLQIIEMYHSNESGKNKEPSFPYAIPRLARTTIRKSKDQKDDKLVSDRIIQLYRASSEDLSLPVTLLKPILNEFHSALVKNDEATPTYPFNQSRFALIKLILTRNRRKEDDFMPTPELCETDDAAYNLGRLLAVLENLQHEYHGRPKAMGPGVVERYYSSASTAPASSFPILCRLARHHLSKLKKGDEKDKAAAFRIEERISAIMGQFKSEQPGLPPKFPRFLTLEAQGRFALGFYQQKAYRQKSGEHTENAPSDRHDVKDNG